MKPVHTFTSETKDTVFYACGECGLATNNMLSAERCCTCDMCGGPRTKRYRYICDGCSPEWNRQLQKKGRDAYLALPVATELEIAKAPGFVLGDDQFFEDLEELVECAWDRGDTLDDIEVYIAKENRPVCDVAGFVYDWLMSDGFDIEDYEVGGKVNDAIGVLNDALADDLPVFWSATTVRVDVTDLYKALDISNDL